MKSVVIIGAGNVGAHIASCAINKDVPAKFLLIDRNDDFEKGQVLDLCDSLLFSPNSRVESADFNDEKVSNADIFIITAGAAQKPGETRIDLVQKNVQILRSIKDSLGTLKPTAVVILVSNPVDILTQRASEIFGLPHGQVFGTGTLLDTARLRWRLARRFDRNPSNVHGYVLGEHGDSEFVAWSTVTKADDFSDTEKTDLAQTVKNAAYKIIEKKGSTYFGIGAATTEILKSVLWDSGKVFPVSVPLNGEYGIIGMSISVPAKIGNTGVKDLVEIELTAEEKLLLQQSANNLKQYL